MNSREQKASTMRVAFGAASLGVLVACNGGGSSGTTATGSATSTSSSSGGTMGTGGATGTGGSTGGAPPLGDFVWVQETTTQMEPPHSIAGLGTSFIAVTTVAIPGFFKTKRFASTDDGKTWPLLTVPPLPDIKLLSSEEFAFVGTGSDLWLLSTANNFGAGPAKLLHTTDGIAWDDFTPQNGAPCKLMTLEPIDAHSLYATTEVVNPPAFTICHSTDAGKTWTAKPVSVGAGGKFLPFSKDDDLWWGSISEYGPDVEIDAGVQVWAPLLHFDGSDVTRKGTFPPGIPSPGFEARPPWGTRLDDLYLATTGALIYHSKDVALTWTTESTDLPGGGEIAFFFGSGPDDMWAAGYDLEASYVLHRKPDGSWVTQFKTPPGVKLGDGGFYFNTISSWYAPSPHEIFLIGTQPSPVMQNVRIGAIFKGTR